MIPSLKDIEKLDESALSEQLNAQIAATLQTERELAVVVKQRDQWKSKAEQIQKLQEGNKGALTETIQRLVQATRNLDADIRATEENIRRCSEGDPQQTARELRDKTEQLRVQNATLRLERAAKAAVCDHFGRPPRSARQLPTESEADVQQRVDVAALLEELDEQKTKGRRKWKGIRSIAALSHH